LIAGVLVILAEFLVFGIPKHPILVGAGPRACPELSEGKKASVLGVQEQVVAFCDCLA